MGKYIFDFIVVSGLIIGLTAILGVLLNGIGEKVFGRGKESLETVNHSNGTQLGWNHVGGKKK